MDQKHLHKGLLWLITCNAIMMEVLVNASALQKLLFLSAIMFGFYQSINLLVYAFISLINLDILGIYIFSKKY